VWIKENYSGVFSAKSLNKNTVIAAGCGLRDLLNQLIDFIEGRKCHWRKKSPIASQ